MASADLERLIGRAVLDTEFRENLLADPEKTVREGGFDLTEREIASLKSVDIEQARVLAEEVMTVAASPWAD